MNTHKSDSDDSQRRGRRGHRARKERVLHTRISEQLSEDIRNFAADLRVPASNLVRNVLEEVFTVVDGVSDDVGDLFDDLIEEAEGVRERVRSQAASSQRRRHRGSSRRGCRSRHRGDNGNHDDLDADAAVNADVNADVEAELDRDEAFEKSGVSAASESPAPEANQTPPTEARPRAAELFPEILGWQPLVLNRDLECGRCNRNLAAGESAFLGLGEQGLTQIALCGRCAGTR
jgi:hypothetical protein